jgi:phage shock protein A
MNPDPARSSYCSQLENKCKKKCKKENQKFIKEAESICAIEDVEEEIVAEALCQIDKLEIQLHECHESCAKIRRQCEEEHPESILEDEVTHLRQQFERQEQQTRKLERDFDVLRNAPSRLSE